MMWNYVQPEFLDKLSPIFVFLFLVAIVWVSFLKLYGLWRSGRNNQAIWFIVLAVLNTAGILPAVYLLWFQKDKGFLERRKKPVRKSKN